MKNNKLIFILLVFIAFSNCTQLKLENNEAEVLIKKTLELPKQYREDIGLGYGASTWLDALQTDGFIIYTIDYHGAFTDPSLTLFPTDAGRPYYLGQDPNDSNKHRFKTNDIDFYQIVGISVQKESKTATIRYSLKASNITPIARTLSKIN